MIRKGKCKKKKERMTCKTKSKNKNKKPQPRAFKTQEVYTKTDSHLQSLQENLTLKCKNK